MSNTHNSAFYEAMSAVIDELPSGKDAPNHRKVMCKTHSPVPGQDLCTSHHGNNLASVLAHDSVIEGKEKWYEDLRVLFLQYETLTTNEIAVILNTPKEKFRPRITEMKAAGLIFQTSLLRDGCFVLRLS